MMFQIMLFDFVNVIEDIRIEKFIQSKFPGLRRDFHKGLSGTE